MISATDIGASVRLPPERAIAFLQRKEAQITGPYTEWLDGQHARGFTAANVTKLDVLQDLQDSLLRTLANGQTLQQWKDGLVPELQRKGWLGRDYTVDQLRQAGRLDESTGEIRKGLTGARLETIFQTNMQSAYMAGRYEEMLDQVDERPFWQYVAVLDSKTRPAHRAMHGRIFRYDDPGWQYFYPPCGYKCRCRVRNLSARDLQRKKLVAETTDGKLHQIQIPLRDGSTATVVRYSPSSVPGASFQPDVGFSNNPALLGWQPKLEPMDVQLSRRYVDTAIQGPAFERFVQGRDAGVFPVAVLRAQEQARLAAETSVAYLSSQTVTKQRDRHPEIRVDDYRRIPDIVDQGDAYQQADNRLVFLFEGDMVWRLALKATASRDELYVLSLFRTTRSAAEKEVRERLQKI